MLCLVRTHLEIEPRDARYTLQIRKTPYCSLCVINFCASVLSHCCCLRRAIRVSNFLGRHMLHGLVQQKTFRRGHRRRVVCFLGWWSSLANVNTNTVGTWVTWHRMCDVREVVKVFLIVLFHETHTLKTCTVILFCAYALTNNIYMQRKIWHGMAYHQWSTKSSSCRGGWPDCGIISVRITEQQNVVAVIRYHAVMYNPKHLCRHVQKLNNIISVRNSLCVINFCASVFSHWELLLPSQSYRSF